MTRRGRADSARAGLTLLEVVIALSLLGLTLTTLLAVNSSGINAWLDSREALAGIRREANWSDQFRSSIAATLPLAAPDAAANGGEAVFFQGEPQELRFVTAHSPAMRGRGGLRLVSLAAFRQGPELSLQLSDEPCPTPGRLGQILAERAPIRRDDRGRAASAIVAEGIASCSFRYLQRAVKAGEAPRWISRWNDPSALPRAVRIEWTLGREGGPNQGQRGHSFVLTAGIVAAGESRIVDSAPVQAGGAARALY